MEGSNLRPSRYQRGALAAELTARRFRAKGDQAAAGGTQNKRVRTPRGLLGWKSKSRVEKRISRFRREDSRPKRRELYAVAQIETRDATHERRFRFGLMMTPMNLPHGFPSISAKRRLNLSIAEIAGKIKGEIKSSLAARSASTTAPLPKCPIAQLAFLFHTNHPVPGRPDYPRQYSLHLIGPTGPADATPILPAAQPVKCSFIYYIMKYQILGSHLYRLA